MDAPERGICDYRTVFVVTTYTSGNELRGAAERLGEFDSDRDARQALTDVGFTNGKFGWRHGYTDATIAKVIKYENRRADLAPQWKPIETTRPRDLDKALLLNDGQPVVGEYLAGPGAWYDQELNWLDMVTHWLPIPPVQP